MHLDGRRFSCKVGATAAGVAAAGAAELAGVSLVEVLLCLAWPNREGAGLRTKKKLKKKSGSVRFLA